MRVTEVGKEYDTHHVMLDFGTMPFPVLEGQSIGIVPPGLDASGRPHHARQYSVASPRNGERPGYNNVSLVGKPVPMSMGESYDGGNSALIPPVRIEDFYMTSISPAV